MPLTEIEKKQFIAERRAEYDAEAKMLVGKLGDYLTKLQTSKAGKVTEGLIIAFVALKLYDGATDEEMKKHWKTILLRALVSLPVDATDLPA